MGDLLIGLGCWAVASVVVGLVAGAVFRCRDRQVPVVVVPPPRRRTRQPATIVIPEPRSARRAETDARLPSR